MAHRWDLIAPPVSGLVHPLRIDPTGRSGPTKAMAYGPHWRQTGPGMFVPGRVDDSLVEQRILEAYVGGTRAVVTGWAGLRMLGGGWFDGLAADGRTRLPVLIAANGDRLRSRTGVLVVADTVPDDEVLVVHGIRCASPERALFDEMRRLGVNRPREMVVAIDMACAGRLTSIRRMRRYCATRRWYRDVRIVTDPLSMAVEGSRSGPETKFRIIWEYDAGWGRPLVNRELFDVEGRFLGIPDLFDPVRGVVGEFAGADHRDLEQHQRDLEREADFRRVGLEYVEVVSRDLRYKPTVISRMAEAESRAGQLPQTWALGPEPAPTLDEVLDARETSSDPIFRISTVDNRKVGRLDGH